MMNFVALCLVLTSLVTAGFLSPAPEKHNQNHGDHQEVIVKDGHRVVVVEYDQRHPNTKVSISPDHDHYDISETKSKVSTVAVDALGNAKDKFKEASSVLPNLGQGLSDGGPKELICDTNGKCKHKIPNAMGKTKEVVSEKAHEAIAKKKETAQEAIAKKKEVACEVREAVEEAYGTAKEAVKHKAHDVGETVEESYDTAKETVKHKAHDVGETVEEAYDTAKETVKHRAHDVGEAVGEAYGKAKEAVTHKAHQAKESVTHQAQRVEDRAKESAEKAKGAVKTAKDTGKTIRTDVVENVSDLLEMTEEEAVEKAKEAKHGAEKVGRESKMGLHRIFEGQHFRFGCLMNEGGPLKSLNPLVGVMNLMGLATAFGMCVWITFIHSHVLAGALPRQQFGVVQSKIYPVYFRAMAWSIGLILSGHLLSHGKRVFVRKAEMFQSCSILTSLLMVLTNLIYLEPRATKVMFERMKLEKEEGGGREKLTSDQQPPGTSPAPSKTTKDAATPSSSTPEGVEPAVRTRIMKLNERLKKLNTCSSSLNILTLMALSCHLVYLGQLVLVH